MSPFDKKKNPNIYNGRIKKREREREMYNNIHYIKGYLPINNKSIFLDEIPRKRNSEFVLFIIPTKIKRVKFVFIYLFF